MNNNQFIPIICLFQNNYVNNTNFNNKFHTINIARPSDNEIYSLYAHIYIGTIYNLKTVDDGYHDQGMFRGLCGLAPNVKQVYQ